VKVGSDANDRSVDVLAAAAVALALVITALSTTPEWWAWGSEAGGLLREIAVGYFAGYATYVLTVRRPKIQRFESIRPALRHEIKMTIRPIDQMLNQVWANAGQSPPAPGMGGTATTPILPTVAETARHVDTVKIRDRTVLVGNMSVGRTVRETLEDSATRARDHLERIRERYYGDISSDLRNLLEGLMDARLIDPDHLSFLIMASSAVNAPDLNAGEFLEVTRLRDELVEVHHALGARESLWTRYRSSYRARH
jgi:hypothetical protein